MLNEYLEFEAYVTNPTSEEPRIQAYLLTDHFNEAAYLIGIEHVMTTIARAFIFEERNHIQEELISTELVNDTIELIHRWTGFSDFDNRKRTDNPGIEEWMKKYPDADGWLKKYWKFQYQYKEITKRENKVKKANKNKKEGEKLEEVKPLEDKFLEKMEELWNVLEKKWNERLNCGLDYYATMITYNNIIANALEIGPLQNRYFVVKKDWKSKDEPVEENKRFKYLSDKSRRQESSDMKIMKIIAAYLVRLQIHPDEQNEVWLRNGDLGNWYGVDDGKNGSKTYYPNDVTWKGKPIYTRYNLRGSFTKVSVDADYLKEFDFKIIDAEDADKYKDTHWVLEDLGQKLIGCWGTK